MIATLTILSMHKMTRNSYNSRNMRHEKKIPPLMVKSVSLGRLQATLKAINISATYKLCRIGIKVVLCTKEDYQKTKTYLERSKTEFFTYDMPSEKAFKAVIRGLPAKNIDDIKADLQQRYKLNPLAVFPMTRHDSRREYRDCLYLVHFKKGSVSFSALKTAKVICDIIVSWENYRGGKRDVTQCMRCLHFGHGARNCRVKPRCGVCTGEHETKECPIEEAVAYKCANCGGEHRATDRTCGKREEFKRIRSAAARQNQPQRRQRAAPQMNEENFPILSSQTNNVPRLPPPGLSYRDQLRLDPPANKSTPWQSSHGQPAEEQPLLTPEQLLPIFREMWIQMKQCRTRADQILCLGEFIIRHG